ncbi:hypothetical protein LIER_37981 [Lithospermum erythrorhizon]|uniref:Uncharacterized protein n=1 Tax=Lithospermum erythrorhizon TaxID=34254 RepID=A0AAV3PSY8_LITER
MSRARPSRPEPLTCLRFLSSETLTGEAFLFKKGQTSMRRKTNTATRKESIKPRLVLLRSAGRFLESRKPYSLTHMKYRTNPPEPKDGPDIYCHPDLIRNIRDGRSKPSWREKR